jgi:hypothetical protein
MKKYIPEESESFIVDDGPELFVRISNTVGDATFTVKETDPTKCLYCINLSPEGNTFGRIVMLNNFDSVDFKKILITFSE